MPACEVWDLVKVPFPYTNRPVQQRRPALVVAIPNAPATLNLLWVMMITSAGNRSWPGDVPVFNLDEAGLPAPSIVRLAKIATIEAHDAERIGRLAPADQLQVADALRECLEQVLTLRANAAPK